MSLRSRKYCLLILVAALSFGGCNAFSCHPDVQERVGWPPSEFGYYEETTSSSLRPLSEGFSFTPARVTVCDEGAQEADVDNVEAVAQVGASPRFLIFLEDLTGFEYHVYSAVEVPETGECMVTNRANEVADIVVEQDENNPGQMAWISLPAPIVSGEVYMLTAGSEGFEGVVFQLASE